MSSVQKLESKRRPASLHESSGKPHAAKASCWLMTVTDRRSAFTYVASVLMFTPNRFTPNVAYSYIRILHAGHCNTRATIIHLHVVYSSTQ